MAQPFSAVRIVLVLLCLVFIFPALLLAELTPDQIAILVNQNSPDSWAVARHYMTRRAVPARHIIALDLPLQESLSRAQYEGMVVPQLRQILQDRKLSTQVRTLITTYGVPMRILAAEPTEQHRTWLTDARDRYRVARGRLDSMEQWIRALGRAHASPKPVTSRTTERELSPGPLDAVFQRVAHEIRDAVTRLQSAPDRQRADREGQELAQLTLQFGGVAALIQRLKPSTVDPSRALLAEKLKRQVAAAEMIIQVLNQSPSDQNRERAYTVAGQVFGLQGTLRLATAELDIYEFQDSDASFDSELSLLWWDAGSYHLAGRTHNPLQYRNDADRNGAANPLSVLRPSGVAEQGMALAVLMVSRLDAPTPELAMQLVDKALQAEQRGLEGNVYVDGRLTEESPADERLFGQSLRDLASMFRSTSAYGLVIDAEDYAIGSSADAAAVYIGSSGQALWKHSFNYSPGALGYHVPFQESLTVQKPGRAWYQQALAHGITVTLGPVDEVPAESYPLPDQLFGLLLSGRYSLVEAYYLTNPYVSWRMVLIGDPLYHPWRTRSGLPSFWKGSLPEPPSRLLFREPGALLRELHQLRQITLAQIERVMPTR